MQQRDVVRNPQRLGHVPTGLIQHQYDMPIRRCLLADEAKVGVHVIGVDCRREHGGGFAGDRVDRAEQIAPFVFSLFDDGRARPLLGPDVGQRALLAEACFVLEPDFDLLLRMLFLHLPDKRGASSSHCCMACSSFLR